MKALCTVRVKSERIAGERDPRGILAPVAIGTQTHLSLLERLAAGADHAAWAEFQHRYRDLIRGYARSKGVPIGDLDDIEQEVFLSLTKAMPGFRYDPAKGLFRSWLRTLVLTAVARRFRQKEEGKRLSAIEEPAQPEDSDGDWEMQWRRYHFRRALKAVEAEFSDSDRAAFEAYVVQGSDAKAVAAELRTSVDAVYQAKSRILRRLSAVIEAQVREEG